MQKYLKQLQTNLKKRELFEQLKRAAVLEESREHLRQAFNNLHEMLPPEEVCSDFLQTAGTVDIYFVVCGCVRPRFGHLFISLRCVALYARVVYVGAVIEGRNILREVLAPRSVAKKEATASSHGCASSCSHWWRI